MPTIKDVVNKEGFSDLPPEAKRIVLEKVGATDGEFNKLSLEAKGIVIDKLVGSPTAQEPANPPKEVPPPVQPNPNSVGEDIASPFLDLAGVVADMSRGVADELSPSVPSPLSASRRFQLGFMSRKDRAAYINQETAGAVELSTNDRGEDVLTLTKPNGDKITQPYDERGFTVKDLAEIASDIPAALAGSVSAMVATTPIGVAWSLPRIVLGSMVDGVVNQLAIKAGEKISRETLLDNLSDEAKGEFIDNYKEFGADVAIDMGTNMILGGTVTIGKAINAPFVKSEKEAGFVRETNQLIDTIQKVTGKEIPVSLADTVRTRLLQMAENQMSLLPGGGAFVRKKEAFEDITRDVVRSVSGEKVGAEELNAATSSYLKNINDELLIRQGKLLNDINSDLQEKLLQFPYQINAQGNLSEEFLGADLRRLVNGTRDDFYTTNADLYGKAALAFKREFGSDATVDISPVINASNKFLKKFNLKKPAKEQDDGTLGNPIPTSLSFDKEESFIVSQLDKLKGLDPEQSFLAMDTLRKSIDRQIPFDEVIVSEKHRLLKAVRDEIVNLLDNQAKGKGEYAKLMKEANLHYSKNIDKFNDREIAELFNPIEKGGKGNAEAFNSINTAGKLDKIKALVGDKQYDNLRAGILKKNFFDALYDTGIEGNYTLTAEALTGRIRSLRKKGIYTKITTSEERSQIEGMIKNLNTSGTGKVNLSNIDASLGDISKSVKEGITNLNKSMKDFRKVGFNRILKEGMTDGDVPDVLNFILDKKTSSNQIKALLASMEGQDALISKLGNKVTQEMFFRSARTPKAGEVQDFLFTDPHLILPDPKKMANFINSLGSDFQAGEKKLRLLIGKKPADAIIALGRLSNPNVSQSDMSASLAGGSATGDLLKLKWLKQLKGSLKVRAISAIYNTKFFRNKILNQRKPLTSKGLRNLFMSKEVFDSISDEFIDDSETLREMTKIRSAIINGSEAVLEYATPYMGLATQMGSQLIQGFQQGLDSQTSQ